MPIRASVIILTKDAGSKLSSVLAAVFSNKPDFGFEVIAVDSGSKDSTKDILAKYPVRLIEIPAGSFSHGGTRNLGAENAKGEFLVFLTQDAVPAGSDWLSNLLGNFAEEDVAGVYGRQLPEEFSSPVENFFLDRLYPEARAVKDSVDPGNCLLKDIFFSNVNSAIRRSDWEKERFKEDLVMSEDQEWAKRILMKGKKLVYDPSAKVIHNHRYTVSSLIRRNFDSGMSLRGIVTAPLKRNIVYELSYLRDGIMHFAKSGRYGYVFIFLFYEKVRVFGFMLGSCSGFLPAPVCRYISCNKAYWAGR